MGSELLCSVRTGGKSASGKVLLETTELVFRGEVRLKIPLASLTSVSARNGELHLKWSDGSAVFDLGSHAEKWAHKILHPKTTIQKLGIKPGLVISVIGVADDGFRQQLTATAGTVLSDKPQTHSDLIFLGAEKLPALAKVAKLVSSLAASGALWVIYPKGKQEIKEQHVLDAGRQAGLLDVKVVSFSASHTALKFVRPKTQR